MRSQKCYHLKYWLILIITMGNVQGLLYSQISAYGSASYGYSNNPLYNYQKLSDQLFQTYVEVGSSHSLRSSDVKLHYVGGSMIFNRFAPRNYYEHSIAAQFNTVLFTPAVPVTQEVAAADSVDQEEVDSLDADEETDENSLEDADQKDLNGLMFSADVQVAARHDKKEFQEFDNYGIISNSSLRFQRGSDLIPTLKNKLEYRNYPHLRVYNNISDIVTLSLETGKETESHYGVFVSAGLKYFSKAKYDTSMFEETRSYVIQSIRDSNLVGLGNNRHWVYFTYPETSASEKTLLQRPTTKSTYQLALGTFVLQQWAQGSIRVEFVYRFNSTSTLLTLVQSSSTLTLNEDLYNSVFNSHGPEVHCEGKYIFPSDIQCSANLDLEQNIYETPAYDLLSGQIINSNRRDIVANMELSISKYFQLSNTIGVDIALNSNFLRNASNDPYNDFSLIGFSLSAGCGF